MPVTYKRLIDGTLLTATAAPYYAAPADTTGVIKKLTFCNVSGADADLTVYMGAADDPHMLIDARTIAAGETFDCYEALLHVIESGDTIQAFASVADAVNIICSGCEVT